MLAKLQNKLIVAFLFIGLVPMLLSTLVVVSMTSRRLEEQMKQHLKKASETTMETIQNYEESAGQIAELYADNPGFVASRRDAGKQQVIRTGSPLIVWMTGEKQDRKHCSGIIQIKEPKVLITGVVVPVSGEDKNLGDLVVGYQLGRSFAKNMSLLTDVEINVIYREEGLENSSGSSVKELEKVFDSGEAHYSKKASFQGVEYEAYFNPLITDKGTVVGIVFCGIPTRYGFLSTVSSWYFLPVFIGLCVFMAGGFGYAIARHISRPIGMFARGVNAVAEGDLNQKMDISSSEELTELSRAFNRMTGRLRELKHLEEELRRKERLAALGELSAGIAHEVRNPLGIIKSSAQVLEKESCGNEKGVELADFIIEEVNSLDRMVGSFLNFANPMNPRLEQCRIEAILDRSLHLAEPKVSNQNITVIKNIASGLPFLDADAELLSQAFLNLIINSVEAMPSGGKLTIRSSISRDYLEVCIADTGEGIPEEIRGKIFNPFFSQKGNGTGLGLAIVHKIVESHNGTIAVSSEVGKGTIFKTRLPV